jgi:photosystem II stability/assembly factor-like uncharacterized protein
MRFAGTDGLIPGEGLAPAWRQLEEGKRNGTLLPAAQTLSALAAGQTWTSIGPEEMTPPGSEIQTNVGRIMAIAVDPRPTMAATHWLVSGQHGGVWETLDGGSTWTPKTDGLPSLAIGSIAFASSNPQIVYAAAGEWQVGGLYRSTDGGTNWTVSAQSTFAPPGGDKTVCSDLRVDPANPDILMATLTSWFDHANQGIYRSTNGGLNWTQIKVGAAQGIVVDSTNFDHQYVAIGRDHAGFNVPVGNNGVWRSLDRGLTFNKLTLPWNTGEAAQFGRAEVGISPSNPNIVYALVQNFIDGDSNDGRPWGFFKTTNAWATTPTWTRLNLPPEFPEVMTVDAVDSNRVHAGGFTQYYFFDGTNWNFGPNNFLIHVDQESMAFAGNRLLIGNDGGLVSTTDSGTTWTSHSKGLRVTEYRSGAVHPTNPNGAMGGAYDNGTSQTTGSLRWRNIAWGDGGYTAYSLANPDNAFMFSDQGSLGRTLDNNATQQTTVIDSVGRAFNYPIERCPNSDGVVLAGSDNLWKSTNFFAAGGPTFTSNSPDVAMITAIGFAASDTTCKTYAFGTSTGAIRLTKDGGTTWTDIDPVNQVRDGEVSYLTFGATANVLYAALAGFDSNTGSGRSEHLYETQNALAASPTWTDISPPVDVPHRSIAVNPGNVNEIYAGTEIGVFATSDRGATWSHLGIETGMPNVPVIDLRLNARTAVLVAFTTGRGAFRLPISAPVTGITLSPTADAHVRDGSTAATNFGTSATLEVKLSTAGFNRDTYMKFDTSSASSVAAAKLQFWATSSQGTAITIAAFPVADTSWTESGITWNNKPALGATQIASVVANGTPLTQYEIDVTSYVKSEKAAGRNVVTLGLHSPTSTTTLATLNSKEAASNKPVLVITPVTGITLSPTADAYVRDGSSAATNFGTATSLNVKLNTSGFNRDSYLKFDLSSASSITSAKLQFFATSSEGTAITVAAFPVSNTTWTETGITWNNKPALGATQIGSVVVNGTPLVMYQIDVTSYAKSEKMAGRNVITLGLHGPASTSTLCTLNSREAASNGPSLVITP